jgi:hypothetical protein
MRWLVRCLSARVGIRNRGVAVGRCSDATVVILRVGFRPLPKSLILLFIEMLMFVVPLAKGFCVFLIEVVRA